MITAASHQLIKMLNSCSLIIYHQQALRRFLAFVAPSVNWAENTTSETSEDAESFFCILIDATWLFPIIEQASKWTGSRWTSGTYLLLRNSDPASKHFSSSLSRTICSYISIWGGWIQHPSGRAAGGTLSLTLALSLIPTKNITLTLTNSATCELNMDVFGTCKRRLPAAVHGGHGGRVRTSSGLRSQGVCPSHPILAYLCRQDLFASSLPSDQ